MRRLLVSICVFLLPYLVFSQELWPEVTKEMKPWVRWWWMGSAVDKANLDREINSMHKAGLGGVEVTPIYGAKGYEDRYIPYFSERWINMLSHTIKTASANSMGVDLNLGTGWPFGGPQVGEQYAATRYVLEEIALKAGEELSFPIEVKDPKQNPEELFALRAYKKSGEQLNLDEYITRTEGTWTAPEEVTVLALFSGKTKQKVKRAAPGGEGFTLDHLGRQSVEHYLSYFQNKMQGKALDIRAFFNDSYEVYGANWTVDFLTEFEKIKGYKLEDHLLEFAGKSKQKDVEKRVKADYREVVNDLLRDNFLAKFTGFAHHNGALSKNQAHGSPGNLIDLYGSSDIAETETFGASDFDIPDLSRDSADIRNVDPDPMMFKFATSATNSLGKKFTSSETFTWLTEHFKTALAQAKPEVEQLFLAGVNHVFYHGMTYSPKEIAFPGWLFYASVNFTLQNPFWHHLSGLNNYITRVQSILQTAKADNELLIYWPVYDLWHTADGPFKQFSVHNIDKWLHPTDFYKNSRMLENRGYSFDFTTDAILMGSKVVDNEIITSSRATPYKMIYIPGTHYFSETTFQKILSLANDGATVLFDELPKDVNGLALLSKRREKFKDLIARLENSKKEGKKYISYGKGRIYIKSKVDDVLLLEGNSPEELSSKGLKFIRRVSATDTYYYLVNHSNSQIDEVVELNKKGAFYNLLDPQTGKTYALPSTDGKVRLQIPSGYSWVVQVSNEHKATATYAYQDNLVEENLFTGSWDVKFLEGGPELPKGRTIEKPGYWTSFGKEATDKFSGLASYETSFVLNKENGAHYLLQLGEVKESAKVWVNGVEAGIVWANPFSIEIGELLKNGQNSIRIEVANLMANRIRDLDQRKVEWRNYHEINFVNIDYKSFDASNWQVMESGLGGPVKLMKY